MKKHRSSAAWCQRHQKDPYVKARYAQKLRSRAWFKLAELALEEKWILKGKACVELGAAPGGWSQYLSSAVGPDGRLVACDLLEMAPLPNVHFVQGDFTETAVQTAICQLLPNQKADLVASDMAPNLTGNRIIDQTRMLALLEAVYHFSLKYLAIGGVLVVKSFEGSENPRIALLLKKHFRSVKARKPSASRSASKELYWVAKGFRIVSV